MGFDEKNEYIFFFLNSYVVFCRLNNGSPIIKLLNKAKTTIRTMGKNCNKTVLLSFFQLKFKLETKSFVSSQLLPTNVLRCVAAVRRWL